jgi:predicted ABC-type ATPase
MFMLPKRVTIVEVAEIGLERSGVQDGVADGGHEVEDKTTKRRSGTRVRYGLTASIEGIGEFFLK